MYARACVMGSYSESEKASQHRKMPSNAVAALLLSGRDRHNPHDARSSGSGLGAAPRSEFALQRQPCMRQATLEHLATPMPFSTGYFRAWASGSRTANNGVHQLSLRARKIM